MPGSIRQLLLLLGTLLLLAVAHAQDQINGNADAAAGVTQSEAALAAKLGVPPHVLVSASQLANRSPQDIVRLLEVNPSATLTDTGAIVFGCGLHPEGHPSHKHPLSKAPSAPKKPDAGGSNPAPPPVTAQDVWDEEDLSKTFKLHSRPSATKKIFLEFGGCVTEGTDGWNKYYNIDKIVTPPYDTDGNTDWISNDEMRDIITIHAGVAEAYVSWDVDVTTENPGFDGLERANEQDEHYGIRMCVGGTSDWTATSIGGIATLNSFGWINKPGGEVYRDSFVFSSGLTDADNSIHLGYIWKSIVHEIGHTLGLVHKGFKRADGVQEYYTIPPGVDLWSPVMGVPGRGLFAQWSKGEYPSGLDPSSNFDDEHSIINKTLPLIPDESGSSTGNAQVLCNTTTCTSDGQQPGWVKTTVLGRVTQPEDKDWYELTVETTDPFKIQLTIHPNYHKPVWQNGEQQYETWRISNLKPEVVFSQDGVNVAPTPSDARTWQQDFEITVPKPGTYTFAVQPTEVLDGDGQSMPSSYGNLGSYQMWAAWPQKSVSN